MGGGESRDGKEQGVRSLVSHGEDFDSEEGGSHEGSRQDTGDGHQEEGTSSPQDYFTAHSPCGHPRVPETPARLPLPVDRGRVVIANLLLFCVVTNTWKEKGSGGSG